MNRAHPPSQSATEKENLVNASANGGSEPRPPPANKPGNGRDGMVRNGANVGGLRYPEGHAANGAVGGPRGDNDGRTGDDCLPTPSQKDVDGYSHYATTTTNDSGYNDDDDEDDCSDASGDTAVHNDLPPPPANATREELNRHYWEWCYGPLEEGEVVHAGRAATDGSTMRSAPAKSCLSTKKKQKESSGASMTPRRILHHSPNSSASYDDAIMEESESSTTDPDPSTPADEEEGDDATPKNNVTRLHEVRAKAQSAVKFGHNVAAEFDHSRPITEMTPLPTAVVLKIFPSEAKETAKEVEEHHETAQNVKTLAEWDDDFDDIIGADGDDGEGANGSSRPRRKRGRRRTPYKLTGGRRNKSLLSRPRKRRESLFSRERKSLVDPIDDERAELDGSDRSEEGLGGRGNLLPFSVTIDPEEYTSPSSASVSDSVSTLGTPGVRPGTNDAKGIAQQTREDPRGSLDSMTSACISPSSLRTECHKPTVHALDASFDSIDCDVRGVASGGAGRESGGDDSNATGKETPNSARTSSSTILRAVHASGALLHGNSPPQPQGAVPASTEQGGGGGGLRPNQLRYSPSSTSSGGSSGSGSMKMDASPSDSMCSLGSDIMSLFTQHSLDDDTDPNLYEQLFIFSSHPNQPLHMRIGDLIRWIMSAEEDPLAFVNEHVLNGLSPLTSLSLISEPTPESPLLLPSDSLEKKFNATLLDEMNRYCSSSPSFAANRKTVASDADTGTTSSVIARFHGISSLEWSSRELVAAERLLESLHEFAEKTKKDNEVCNQFIASCCKQVAESSMAIMQQLSESNATAAYSTKKQLKLRKRKAKARMEGELAAVTSLEECLALEADRLDCAKRARATFGAHLELEKASPVSALSSEIRSAVVIGPASVNTSDFTFQLLDGSAEIAARISLHEGVDSMELGCFIKDGGQAIKLLQAILLGDIEMRADETTGSLPLRTSLSSAITQNETLEEALFQTALLVSRIDNIVRSVRALDMNSICTVEPSVDVDVNLSVSMLHEGTVVQLGFVFSNLLGSDWQVKSTPDDVTVSIVKAERDLSSLANRLQERARTALARSSRSDPFLLERICDEAMRSFDQAIAPPHKM